MSIEFTALSTDDVQRVLSTGIDDYGLPIEQHISDGDGLPCRHCLGNIDAGEPFLILAWRPFTAFHAYAETGPVFLHAKLCERAKSGADLPPILTSQTYMVRGYDSDERIVYGSGCIVDRDKIKTRAAALLENEKIAFIHVRSAANNCFQCRIDRSE